MASRKVDELPDDSQELATICGSPSRCSRDDITEEPQSDALNATVKKPGKFRRTALTFFGVRKNICILPSLFGGRSKNPNKWSSKKGITKSKTHDGLSKVCHEDCLRGRDSENLSQRESSGEVLSCCHRECSHPAAEQKSLTLGRQKRGLRGLFSSFKHHRNNRNLGAEKTEMTIISSSHCKTEVPVVQDNIKYVTECLGSEPDVPDFAVVTHDVSNGAECSDVDEVALESVEQESPKTEPDDQMCDIQMEEMSLMAVVSSDYEEPSGVHSEPCLKVQTATDSVLKSGATSGSSDQLNLMFGDVASLKSFDSLTGCGDIIADQEDDSITTESTVSGERSRNAGKRASCYLTYQGGGEEMASPEDLDEECLHEYWANKALEKAYYACNQDHTEMTAELSSQNVDALNSNSAQQASSMDTSMADVLTPQSEHQESVPTSDEGYYDSTTPGPEEGQDKADRLGTDRLPRDSYSGDALYELFAPDESLISPHYENKSKLPGSKHCEYLTEAVDVTDSAFVPDMDRLQISTELYDVHNFLERSTSELGPNSAGRQEISLNKDCNLNLKPQGNNSNTEAGQFDEKGNTLASLDKRTKATSGDCEKRHSSISFGSTSDPDFEAFCEPKEQHLEENKPVALPYRSISSQSPDSNSDADHGLTVCFSQALVDYTKHSQMLGNLHSSMGDLETNPALTPNIEALPTIVTFDVVDMHNEGEYDQQIHMELEEDISSPYQEFEDSYLQKDAFAELDFQMLDLYEQNMISNTWAVASLPRHLGLTRVSPTVATPLSLDRRSRSLDTESLELNMADTYREERATIVSRPQTEQDPDRDCSPHYKKNVHVSASDAKDCSSIMALSWQPRSDMALSRPLTDGEVTEPGQSVSQTHVKQQLFSRDVPDGKLQRLCPNMSNSVPCDLTSQNLELYNRQCHLPLQSDSCSPHGTYPYPGMLEEEVQDDDDDDDDEVFCNTASKMQSYKHFNQSCRREDMSRSVAPKEEMSVLRETRLPRDVALVPRDDL